MGNRFNKKTTIVLRPPVCKSAPPPDHPNPPPLPTCSLALSASSVVVGGTVNLVTDYSWTGLSVGASVPQVWLPAGGSVGSIINPANQVPGSGTAIYTAGYTPGAYTISVAQGPAGTGACPNSEPITIIPLPPIPTICNALPIPAMLKATHNCPTFPALHGLQVPCIHFAAMTWIGSFNLGTCGTVTATINIIKPPGPMGCQAEYIIRRSGLICLYCPGSPIPNYNPFTSNLANTWNAANCPCGPGGVSVGVALSPW